MGDTSRSPTISTRLQRIAEQAKCYPEMVFTTLAHLMDVDFLREAYHRTRKDSAPGIDGVTAETYAEHLDENLRDLHERLRSGRYQAPPVKRHWLSKADGSQRPIGLPTFEDKIVQRAVTMLLGAIYEEDFHEFSHGFRAGHSAHQALSELREQCREQRINWIVDADVSGFFDSLGHDLLQEMLQRRVKDGSILRLIGKWLHAGVWDGETLLQPDTGTPQGAVVSPLLGNLFLHQVLDEWYVRMVKPRLRGRSFLIRYGDDVRHIPWRQIPFTERRGSEDKTPGSTTYLEAKAEGDSSRSLKRRAAEGVYGAALQAPRDTVRATLPKAQFPGMEAYLPCRQRLRAGSLR